MMEKIKISGAEYKYIAGLDWPDAWEAEGVRERINGGEWSEDGIDAVALNDSDLIEIDGGEIITWDGGIRPPRGGYIGWIKANIAKLSERRIVVVCDASKVDAVIASVRTAGGEVAK